MVTGAGGSMTYNTRGSFSKRFFAFNIIRHLQYCLKAVLTLCPKSIIE